MTGYAVTAPSTDAAYEVGRIVFVAVGSRLGERGWIKKFSGGQRVYVWLEPVDSEQPLGYYHLSELSADGLPISGGAR